MPFFDWKSVAPLYIPLCFYYIAHLRRHTDSECRLYIPLCFYYIETDIEKLFDDVTLHSTMLLLYQSTKTVHLLIILPLHSTMLLLYPLLTCIITGCLNLYIPLCFYYITDLCDGEQNHIYFTFHYASTISGLPESIANLKFYFTFHYASTISLLHENGANIVHLYIPLCFYYI